MCQLGKSASATRRASDMCCNLRLLRCPPQISSHNSMFTAGQAGRRKPCFISKIAGSSSTMAAASGSTPSKDNERCVTQLNIACRNWHCFLQGREQRHQKASVWSAGCETFDAIMLNLPVNAHVASLLIDPFFSYRGSRRREPSTCATCDPSQLKLPVKPSLVGARYSPDGLV